MTKLAKKPYCRWLHLSDLHLISKAEDELGREMILYGSKGELLSNEATNIDEGGLKWYVGKNAVDCIIITGDFFFRGNYDKKTKEKLKSFLQTLYQICSNAANWRWNVGEPMKRLFWCPGNHDLDRMAVVFNEEGPVFRKDMVLKASEEGCFAPNQYAELLTERAFHQIYEFMCELRGETLEQDIYETQLFKVPTLNDPSVCFLAINTALLAGQAAKEDVNKKIERTYEDFFKYHNTHDSAKALDEYGKYHEYLRIRNGQVIEDEGKLCFVSEESSKRVHSQLKEIESCIAILIGHHPYAFLDKDARNQFKRFVLQNAIKLYLHGHTHIAQNDEPSGKKTSLFPQEMPIRSVGVGGLYLNSRDNYNQLSFSVGSIVKESDGKYKYSITLLIFSSASYNDRQWLEVASPIQCDCAISHPQKIHTISIPAMKNASSDNDQKKDISEESLNVSGAAVEMNTQIRTEVTDNIAIDKIVNYEDDFEVSRRRLNEMIQDRKSNQTDSKK